MAEIESKLTAQVNIMEKAMSRVEKQLTSFSDSLNKVNKGGMKAFLKGIENLASAMQTVKGTAPESQGSVSEAAPEAKGTDGLLGTLNTLTAGMLDAAGAYVTDLGSGIVNDVVEPVKKSISKIFEESLEGPFKKTIEKIVQDDIKEPLKNMFTEPILENLDKIAEPLKAKGEEMGNIFYSGFQTMLGKNTANSDATTGTSGLDKLVGIAAIIGGATFAVGSFFTMWQEGFSWLNEILMLLGIAIATVGVIILAPLSSVGVVIAAVVGAVVAAIATAAILLHDNWDAVCEWFSGVAEWFNVNVITPVATFFGGLWTTVSGFFSNLWNDIVTIWQIVSTWFNDNVIQPVVTIFDFFKTRISQVFEGLWIIVKAVWIIVSSWFNEHVIEPVVNLFSGFKAKVSDIFESVVSFVLGIWNTVSSWINEHVIIPISNLFWSLYDKIKDIATSIGNAIKGAISGPVNVAISWIESGVNFIIDGINEVIKGFNNIVSKAAKIANTSWKGVDLIAHVTIPRISGYEIGGFPQRASLFWAGERGVPELLGTVGGKTAVAGGDEITGIRDEIRSSGMTEAQLLKTAIGLLGVIAEKDTTISSDDLFRSVQGSSRNYTRRTGKAAFDF